MTPESARWLLGLMNDTSVRLGHANLLSVAEPAAKARAELVAVIEDAESEQTKSKKGKA